MSFVSANVIKLDDQMFKNLRLEKKMPWLVSFCREVDEGECLDDDQVYKLAVMLVGFDHYLDAFTFHTIYF